jgi:RNA polymerase sigma-70 factor (ECF subfamily)
MKLVRSLSTAYRTVFNLYVLDGFTHEEISQQLGISVGTSKSNLSKARERLRQLILQQMQQ